MIGSTFALALACGLFSMQAMAQGSANTAPGSGPGTQPNVNLESPTSTGKSGTGGGDKAPPIPTAPGNPPPPPPPGGGTPAVVSEIITLNATAQSMWVTVYAPNIVGAGCVAAGKSKAWKINPTNRGAHRVRAEMTSTPDCKSLPGNKHVVCDTQMAMASHAALQLKGKPGQCWWEPAARARM